MTWFTGILLFIIESSSLTALLASVSHQAKRKSKRNNKSHLTLNFAYSKIAQVYSLKISHLKLKYR